MKNKPFKVFISVDMEGITGVIDWKETDTGSPDYEYFRKVMTQETNAAIEAALESGADEVIVRDAHGSGLNILLSDLHRDARLLRKWADSPFCMMEGLDRSFSAVIFIGYHAAANTPSATLKHTMTTKFSHVRINGIPMAEASINSLIAGYHHVPLVFISGDKAICDYAQRLWPDVEQVAVKEGIGEACLTLHPDKTRELIRNGVKKALSRHASIAPYTLTSPYVMEIDFREEGIAYQAQWFPGVQCPAPMSVRYVSDDFLSLFKFFYFMMKL